MIRAAALLALSVGVLASSGCRRESKPDAGVVAAIDTESFRARARVPGIAWARVVEGRIETDARGNADGELVREDTVFEAASIGKIVIASCVMQLVVEEKKLELDVDVARYLDFAIGRSITLRQLLTHTASILDDERSKALGRDVLGPTLKTWFDHDAGVFMPELPGSKMQYSNVGAALAALIVERVSGVPFWQRARDRVFVPLEMRSAAFGRAHLQPGARIAAPHSERLGRLSAVDHALYPVVDLYSSAADLGRLARALLELRLAGSEAMLRDGLGLQHREFGTRRVVGHEGEDAGASTGLYLDRTRSRAAVVLSNGDAFSSGEPNRANAIGGLFEALLE